MELLFKEEFYKIKQACIEVRKNLGNGFLEKVYERALVYELTKLGFFVQVQFALNVSYKDITAGEFIADIVVNKQIVIELKTVKKLNEIHKAQVLNYLKATNHRLGILVNFPPDRAGVEVERVPNFIESRIKINEQRTKTN
jgi:GxxExxY protein